MRLPAALRRYSRESLLSGNEARHRIRAGNRIPKPAMMRRSARALYLTDYQERVAGVGLQARAYAAWVVAAIFNTVESFYLPRPAFARGMEHPRYFVVRSGNLAVKFVLPTNSPILRA
jgi:hypothetical protein